MRPSPILVSLALNVTALFLSGGASAQPGPMPFAISTFAARSSLPKPSRLGISPIRCTSSGCAR